MDRKDTMVNAIHEVGEALNAAFATGADPRACGRAAKVVMMMDRVAYDLIDLAVDMEDWQGTCAAQWARRIRDIVGA